MFLSPHRPGKSQRLQAMTDLSSKTEGCAAGYPSGPKCHSKGTGSNPGKSGLSSSPLLLAGLCCNGSIALHIALLKHAGPFVCVWDSNLRTLFDIIARAICGTIL